MFHRLFFIHYWVSLIFCYIFPLCLLGQINGHVVFELDNFTPYSASENLLSFKRAAASLENRYFQPILFDESKKGKKALGIFYRGFIRNYLLESFLDRITILTLHEVFGHGYRQREFGFSQNFYHINISLITASGFASLGTATPGRVFTNQEKITWFFGGKEATSVLGRNMRRDWMMNQRIYNNEIILYTVASQKLLEVYFAAYKNGSSTSDTELFLREINNHYGFFQPDAYPLTIEDLKKKVLVEFLKPINFIAGISYLRDYLYKGKLYSKLPMISLGKKVKYLPNVQLNYTPYGIETMVENYFKTPNSLFNVYGRWGDDTFASSWGIGVITEDMIMRSNFSISPEFELWHQPELILGKINTTEIKDAGLGGAFKLKGAFKLNKNPKDQLWAFTKLGYKTKGYSFGEYLENRFILRFGFRLKKVE